MKHCFYTILGHAFPTINDLYIQTAKIHLHDLKKKHRYWQNGLIPKDAQPVMSVTEQSELLALPTGRLSKSQEEFIITDEFLSLKVTRYLQRLFKKSDLILVNCEDIKWIETIYEHSDNYMKPDFLLIKKGLQQDCPETGSRPLRALRRLPENKDVVYSFGKLSDWRIRDCIVAVIDCKVDGLKPRDFGRLVSYLQHLTREDNKSTFYGMVCDSTDVWLVTCTEGMVDTHIHTKWTNPGSAQLIRTFFSQRNDWCCLLDHCCAMLAVQLDTNCAVLGCGSRGRIFRVRTKDGSLCAMKIVHSLNAETIAGVELELEALRSIKAAGGNIVTVVGSPTYFIDPLSEEVTGIGYLMAEAGVVVTEKECSNQPSLIVDIFQELYTLHRLRKFHGDPRIPNIIRYNDVLLWIDAMRISIHDPTKKEFPDYVKHDVKTLYRSIYDMELPNTISVVTALDFYAVSPSDATFDILMSLIIK